MSAAGGYSSLRFLVKSWQCDRNVIQCKATGFFVCVWGKMLNVASTLVSASQMGLFSINSAATKAAFQGYPHKAAWICFAVMSACLFLTLALAL